MVKVPGALLLARQTASRKLSVEGTLVTEGLVQALSLSKSAVVVTFNVNEPGTGICVGAACDDVRTNKLREPLTIVCGNARAAMGVPVKETAALGLAVLPDVSRMLSLLLAASRTITSCVVDSAKCG